MANRRLINIFLPAVLALIALALILFYPDRAKGSEDNRSEQATTYYANKGHIFGTYYNIRYAASRDYEADILKLLGDFDASLSTFNPESTISQINQNKSCTTDKFFEQMFTTAQRISELSDGAFDITVAPLVNAWGFGFEDRQQVDSALIDSLLDIVGYRKVSLSNHRLEKSDPRIKLDASAIAKGYSCDVVADFLADKGISNYLVDIGGEIHCHGVNSEGQPWAIGIDRPDDDLLGKSHRLQAIVRSDNLALATSGNYRQFYYDNGVRRSHTIDPRTGYPVNHRLLSASVIAPTCMQADALATACMVLGETEALRLINSIPQADCMLIVAQDSTEQVIMTEGMKKITSEPAK